jgi:hypothetical protein
MYPGERFETKDAQGNGTGSYGEYPYINYKVRPASQFINWLNTDNDPTDRVCVTNFYDPDTNGNGKITFNPLYEGNFMIMGSIPGRKAQVNVMVKNNYHLAFDGYYFERNPGGKGPASDRPVDTGTRFITINYTLSPPNASLSPQDYSRYALDGFFIEITRNSAGNDRGRVTGVITIECTKDLDWQYASSGYPVLFDLIQPDGNTANNTRELKIKSYFNKEDYHLVPVFERITGNYSNNAGGRPNGSSFLNRYGYPNGSIKNGTIKYPVGAGVTVKGGEFITYTGDDIYHLYLSDGEEAYLLFDKVNPGATVSNLAISYPGKDNTEDTRNGRKWQTQDQKQRLGPTYEELTLANQGKALRMSGGADFVLFSRFGSDYDLEVELSSDYTGIIETVYNPSAAGWLDGELRTDVPFDTFKNLMTISGTGTSAYYYYTFYASGTMVTGSFSQTTRQDAVLSTLQNQGAIVSYRQSGSNYLVTFYYADKTNQSHTGNFIVLKNRAFQNGTAAHNVFGNSGSGISYRDAAFMSNRIAPATIWNPLADTYRNKETGENSPVIQLEFFGVYSVYGNDPAGYGSYFGVIPRISNNSEYTYFKSSPNWYTIGNSDQRQTVENFQSYIAQYNLYTYDNPKLDNINGGSGTPKTHFHHCGFKNMLSSNTFFLWRTDVAYFSSVFNINPPYSFPPYGNIMFGGSWNGELKALDFMARIDDIIPKDMHRNYIIGDSSSRYYLYLNYLPYNNGSLPSDQKTYLQFNSKAFKKNNTPGSTFSHNLNKQLEFPFRINFSGLNNYILVMDIMKQRINPANESEVTQVDNTAWEYRFYPLGSHYTSAVYEYSPKVNGQHKTDNGADEIIITYNARGTMQTIKIYVHYEIRQCAATYDPDAPFYYREGTSWDDLRENDINSLYKNYNGNGKDPDGSEINGLVKVAGNYWPTK